MSKKSPAEFEEDSALLLFRALLRVEILMRTELRREFDQWELTGRQWDVVRVLGEAAPEDLTLGEISQRLVVTPGNVTGLIDRMEAAGYVRRCEHPSDRRAMLTKLTEAGLAAYLQINPVHRGKVAALLAGLSATERRDLTELLRRLADSIVRLTSEGQSAAEHDQEE